MSLKSLFCKHTTVKVKDLGYEWDCNGHEFNVWKAVCLKCGEEKVVNIPVGHEHIYHCDTWGHA